MSDILHTAFDAAEILAATGDTEYRSVELVYARNGTGDIVPYCRPDDWDATPVAVLALKDAQIAALREEVERLLAQLERQAVVVEEAVALAEPARQNDVAAEEAPDDDSLMCTVSGCNEGPFKTLAGRKSHERIKHKTPSKFLKKEEVA